MSQSRFTPETTRLDDAARAGWLYYVAGNTQDEIARKLGEEAVEAVVAALSGSDEELVGEAADVLFHLMVLLADRDIALADVLAELDRREGVSGIEEKANREESHAD